MNHIRLNAKGGQNDEREVIFCRDNHAFTGTAGVLVCDAIEKTFGIHWFVVDGRNPNAPILSRADGDIKVALVGSGHRRVIACVSEEEAEDNVLSLVFDRRDARLVYFIVRFAVFPEQRLAVRVVVIAGGGIPDAETCRVLDNEPGEEQARNLEDADQHKQKQRQNQSEFHNGLRLRLASRPS